MSFCQSGARRISGAQRSSDESPKSHKREQFSIEISFGFVIYCMKTTSTSVPAAQIRAIPKISEPITVGEDKQLRIFAGSQRHWDHLGAEWRLPFGWIYSVDRKTVPIPPLLHGLALRIVDAGLTEHVPDQIVYQAYLSDQFLSCHVDAPIFRGPIVSVSMLSTSTMRFRHSALGLGPDLELEPRCALAISDEARTDWQQNSCEAPVQDREEPSRRLPVWGSPNQIPVLPRKVAARPLGNDPTGKTLFLLPNEIAYFFTAGAVRNGLIEANGNPLPTNLDDGVYIRTIKGAVYRAAQRSLAGLSERLAAGFFQIGQSLLFNVNAIVEAFLRAEPYRIGVRVAPVMDHLSVSRRSQKALRALLTDDFFST
jgi:hypothetical protein